MKKIDYLILRQFLPPFITWFVVAVFVFNMQFLWKYIDDIVGKGLEFSIILELLFYQALAMIPRALVFGVALASVMCLGNLAEHYELAALKSSGISLLRVMLPLMFLVSTIGTVSFLISNFAIPTAMLKFKARLFDIRKQKPTLNLQAGRYNDDFKNFIIYIANKDATGRHLEGVRIYDHSQQMGNVSQTNAEKGEIFFEKGDSFLVIKLFDGERQEEHAPDPAKPNTYPYWRIGFKQYTSFFDMQQFGFKKTDEEIFNRTASILSIRQLKVVIDSINKRAVLKLDELNINNNPLFHARRPQPLQAGDTPVVLSPTIAPFIPVKTNMRYALADTLTDFAQTVPDSLRASIYQRAIGSCKQVLNNANNTQKTLKTVETNEVEYENEIHQKVLYAFACLLFLFVGAPMGAIIRKGGFGLPVLVAFVFFMIFFVLGLVGERLAKELVTPIWVGAWLPCLVLLPLAVYVNYKALNDNY
jgi:lipopolysaccharide export system permease protein